ncbi:MAG: epimerase [Nitrospirae bacterium CG18_big_fil_WC_8_21_14_2_50_70_55]|nr:NAD-dependent epimerase/dehydratase family protein [Deltaproteobacteria bacterium]OIP67207.1 MAG: epimerase [Nitrospirae bacterium CG2_30_70_394]PIQ04882.1 MAG: epimerase [Nitrospirae bacterium CG18_big_fil_WC_8_21_14_2_50_70_55]PIU78100.1 MAG: epimerase [Nitrospirae bacterium CG06_land_8_20_14_3_00_70_43]PIW82163.1 MAG: epimerase [Nitrospirae bacterium CG_4_8_14_3_um_filter_70_85]PIX83419.1 MAG: epimerase [Nitrospirae bacterium CG_4_10_14_3_um_filter_70_108]PJB97039.1 MAG: epimerase [Nitr
MASRPLPAGPKTLFITGGAGFIGSTLIERLLARGDRVVCLDDFDDFYDPAIKRRNVKNALTSDRYRLVEGDICDLPLLQRLFAEEQVDVVVHIAARAGVRPSIVEPLLYQKVNVEGSNNLFEVARAHAVPNFVFTSSSSVYGENEKVPFAEADPVNYPISPYAATKRAGELIAHTYHHLFGLNITCLRPFTVYGPRQRPEMAIHLFLRAILDGRPIKMFGDGTSSRDYTYVDDLVDGFLGAIDRPLGYEIINLGEHEVTTLKELIDMIGAAVGKRPIIEQLPMQPGDVPRTYADVSKAKRLLGYQPKVSMQEGIRRFVEWYLAQGARG